MSEEEGAAALAPFGGFEAARESLRRFRENREYLDAHREELTARYPDEWVCVVDRRVVAHADSPEGAVRMLDESGGPREGVVLRHLPSEPRAWLL